MSALAHAPRLPAPAHPPGVSTGRAGPLPVCEGNPRQVLQAALAACAAAVPATLAVVLETEGSTYVRAGTFALFSAGAHVGWLSGGCLEPEIERRAARAAAGGCIDWLEIDTRDDDALFGGAATGCRGMQRIALLPLAALPGCEAVLSAWLDGQCTLQLGVSAHGHLQLAAGAASAHWQLPGAGPGWTAAAGTWRVRVPRAPGAWVLGAGPEATTLLPLLRDLGWRVRLHEPRTRWMAMHGEGCDAGLGSGLADALASLPAPDVALVMHHSFERDRDALELLADAAVPFIGLLGPPRRRDDLFRLLSEPRRNALRHRLHAPVGADLGGRGPQAIALSIAAQLQAWRHGADA